MFQKFFFPLWKLHKVFSLEDRMTEGKVWVLDFFRFDEWSKNILLPRRQRKLQKSYNCLLYTFQTEPVSVLKNFSRKDSFFSPKWFAWERKNVFKSQHLFLGLLFRAHCSFKTFVARMLSETKRLRKGADRNNWMQNRFSKKGWSWMRECKPFKAKSLGNNEAATTLNLWLLEWETRYKQCRSCGHRCKQFALNKTTLLERL